jgi:hypothetical protein
MTEIETQLNNRTGSITLAWADSDYTFRLPWSGLIELQEKTNAGPGFLLDQMWQNNWKVQHISEVIRLGLIGGGQTPADALRLTRNYVEARPPLENLSLAQAILAISLQGAPEEDKGEAKAVVAKTNE